MSVYSVYQVRTVIKQLNAWLWQRCLNRNDRRAILERFAFDVNRKTPQTRVNCDVAASNKTQNALVAENIFFRPANKVKGGTCGQKIKAGLGQVGAIFTCQAGVQLCHQPVQI